MKDIKQIIEQGSASRLPTRSSTSRTSTGSEPLISPETGALVNMIFARFTTIYGHKFKSVFQSEREISAAKREWALSLQGYSEQELVRAVNQCKERFAWMPTITEFLDVLRPDFEDYGLPPALAAYEEACYHADRPRSHQWSHPAVFFAGRATDWFRLRTEDKAQVFRDFEHHYQLLCKRVAAGEELDVPLPQGLPDKSSNTLVEFIQRWGEEQGVTPEQAATLLYYLFKPKGSPVREQFRQRAQERAKAWGLNLVLPEDYQ